MKLRMRLHGYLKDEQWTAMDGTQLNPALPDISMTTSGNQDAYFRAVYMDNGVGEHKFFVPVTESERIEHESIQSKTITEIQRQIYGLLDELEEPSLSFDLTAGALLLDIRGALYHLVKV